MISAMIKFATQDTISIHETCEVIQLSELMKYFFLMCLFVLNINSINNDVINIPILYTFLVVSLSYCFHVNATRMKVLYYYVDIIPPGHSTVDVVACRKVIRMYSFDLLQKLWAFIFCVNVVMRFAFPPSVSYWNMITRSSWFESWEEQSVQYLAQLFLWMSGFMLMCWISIIKCDL